MDIAEYKDRVHEQVIVPMLEFMADDAFEDCSREHVQTCERLLNDYATALATLTQPTDQTIMQLVKSVLFHLSRCHLK